MKFNADVDIDVGPMTNKGKYGIGAIIVKNGNLSPHPSGYYVDTNMPVDIETQRASIEYKDADQRGYIKFDLLSNSSLELFTDKSEYLDAIHAEPDWEELQKEQIIVQLPQVADHADILRSVQPRSIQELADVIALIRPGKTHLIEPYLKNREQVRKNLYRKPKDGVYFKKSHAVSYAILIVGVLNKLDNKTILKF